MTSDKEFIELTRVFILLEGVLTFSILILVLLGAIKTGTVLLCVFLAVTRVEYYRRKIKAHYASRGYSAWWRDVKF